MLTRNESSDDRNDNDDNNESIDRFKSTNIC